MPRVPVYREPNDGQRQERLSYRQDRSDQRHDMPEYRQNMPEYPQYRSDYRQERPDYRQERPGYRQERSGYHQDGSVQRQDGSVQRQDRSGHQQDRSDHRQDKSDQHQEKSGQGGGNPSSGISTMMAHFIAATGEFVGTFMWLFLAFSCQTMLNTQSSETSIANGGGSSQKMVFTALVYGLSLLVNVWAFFRISGGLFNPAVTLGMALTGGIPPVRGLFLFPAQLIAAMCAAALVQAMVPGDITLCNTTLSPGTSIAQGVFLEMFMTAELVFVVLMLAAEKSKDTFLAPIGIGLALFVAMLGGVYYTGGSLNPARSFGPAVAGTDFPGYHWIYWVGPFLGAGVAAGYYKFVKYFNYEEVNPGQDASTTDLPA